MKKIAIGSSFLLVALLAYLIPLQLTWSFANASSSINVWWPTSGAHLQGSQPFKAQVSGLDVSQYEMFWQVDGGSWVPMSNSYTDYQHKEAQVDLTSWSWRGSGPYAVNFIAQQNGAVVAQQSIDLYVDNGQATAPVQVVAQPTVAPASVSSTDPDPVHALLAQGIDPDPVHQAQKTTSVVAPAPTSAPITQQTTTSSFTQVTHTTLVPVVQSSNTALYVDPHSPAAVQAVQWQTSRPTDAAKMQVLAAQPTAKWFGNWSGDIQSAASSYVSQATAAGKVAMLVAYNIPTRDCGGYSAGGTNDYTNWIGGLARGIGDKNAIVVLEPDALAGITCLSQDAQAQRLQLLSSAVSILKANANTKVYLDAGHSGWVDPATMATRLQKANIAKADGFALNVSNFDATGSETDYGTRLSQLLGGKHFVIDTSRNGNGSNGEWCNPWGRAIGEKPTTSTGNAIIDAYLWLKTPGESDGTCNGGPSAGTWWPDYAVSLVR